MKLLPMEQKIEDIILEFVHEEHTKDLKTGKLRRPSFQEFQNAVWNARRKLTNLFEAQCKNCPLLDAGGL